MNSHDPALLCFITMNRSNVVIEESGTVKQNFCILMLIIIDEQLVLKVHIISLSQ